MTRNLGTTPRPDPSLPVGRRKFGTQEVSAMAPALHPARAAPARHSSAMAAQTRVPRSESATWVGLPPER